MASAPRCWASEAASVSNSQLSSLRFRSPSPAQQVNYFPIFLLHSAFFFPSLPFPWTVCCQVQFLQSLKVTSVGMEHSLHFSASLGALRGLQCRNRVFFTRYPDDTLACITGYYTSIDRVSSGYYTKSGHTPMVVQL
jgi:hypothetical protein